jgi:hypothetical protein
MLFFIASLYAMIGAIIFFFFRAIRNINAISGEKQRSPYSTFFMLIPIMVRVNPSYPLRRRALVAFAFAGGWLSLTTDCGCSNHKRSRWMWYVSTLMKRLPAFLDEGLTTAKLLRWANYSRSLLSFVGDDCCLVTLSLISPADRGWKSL